MTRHEKVILPWQCMLGKKSDLNLAGKILFFPLIVIVASVMSLFEFAFSDDDEP